jgi:hypothetical protein
MFRIPNNTNPFEIQPRVSSLAHVATHAASQQTSATTPQPTYGIAGSSKQEVGGELKNPIAATEQDLFKAMTTPAPTNTSMGPGNFKANLHTKVWGRFDDLSDPSRYHDPRVVADKNQCALPWHDSSFKTNAWAPAKHVEMPKNGLPDDHFLHKLTAQFSSDIASHKQELQSRGLPTDNLEFRGTYKQIGHLNALKVLPAKPKSQGLFKDKDFPHIQSFKKNEVGFGRTMVEPFPGGKDKIETRLNSKQPKYILETRTSEDGATYPTTQDYHQVGYQLTRSSLRGIQSSVEKIIFYPDGRTLHIAAMSNPHPGKNQHLNPLVTPIPMQIPVKLNEFVTKLT